MNTMSDYIIKVVTPDELEKMHIAVNDIRFMETHDKEPSERYFVAHEKGDEYRKLKLFPWPHYETRVYEDTVIVSREYFTRGVEYTPVQISDDYIVEDGKVWLKPHILICYGDRKLNIKYDSTQSMMRGWENLKYRFEKLGLKFIF